MLIVLSQIVLASIPVSVLLAMTRLKTERPSVRLGFVALGLAVTVLFLLAAQTQGVSGASVSD
ncbi:hypothetical protein [Streptomyces alboflavus]|uniref:hypothetical protein n=1 Tax=Streptomyces alboflavus TaxID=67267 RepID=UPI0004BF991B|nr:hypothetical protein [Streptomyces alboflavus]